MVVVLIVLSDLLAVLLGFWLDHRSGKSKEALLERLLDDERTRTGDLLMRLAARNLGEYQAYAQPAEQPERDEYITDDTGLIMVRRGDD